ncbi:TPA: hypothetical protein EYP38_02790 [Candidatus Micrarchaeota archaeon]|nr:hypothetical protein [Candidatus Micrarchaeota archaeon]
MDLLFQQRLDTEEGRCRRPVTTELGSEENSEERKLYCAYVCQAHPALIDIALAVWKAVRHGGRKTR